MRTWLSRLADLVLRRRRDERLSEEMQAHLDMLTDEHMTRGLSREDAALAARKSFGGVDQTKMRYREQRGLPVVDALVQDVRFAVRLFARERGFALTAIVVLAVGIGVNNMFFTLVYAHKFRGLAIERPERVLSIYTVDDRGTERGLSAAEFDDLQREQRSFASLGGWSPGVVAVGDADRAPDRHEAAYVSSAAFPALGLTPIMGRGVTANEDRPGEPQVVLLGANAWRNRYDADPQILGRTILVNGTPTTVIGVVAERSGFPSAAGVWLPFGQLPGLSPRRDARTVRVFGRLRDNAIAGEARAEVEAIAGRWAQAYPETTRNVRPRVVELNERLLGDITGWEPFIMAGIIVILVACANVANLMISRAAHRAPEIAVRTSLGASRWRIVRQLLIEATVLAVLGGAGGGLLSVAGVRLFQAAIPEGTLPYWFDYSMDGGVFAALILISLSTIAVFGVIPALHSSRTDVNRTLKDGGRGGSRRGMGISTTAFLTVELALAMVMLTQVALGIVTSRPPIPTDANIDSEAVMTTAITLPAPAYPTAIQREQFFQRLDERLRGHGSITAVSRATLLPGSGGGAGLQQLEIESQPRAAGTTPPTVQVIEIAPSYFGTLDLGLLTGRDFSTGDTSASSVAIVNDRFAEVYLPGVEALGARIALISPSAPADAALQWLTVVGLAPEIRQQGPRGRAGETPVVYTPIAASSPATSILMVRHTVDSTAAANLLRTEAHAVDPNVPLYRMQTLAGAVYDALWNARVSAYVATSVCLLSVLLAMVGLYAVTAQRVGLKTREIGVRMALGARSWQVMRLILGGLRVPLVLGLLLGTAGAIAWDGAFSTGIAGIYASAPRTLLMIAALLAIVVLIACYVPVRRATRLNPVAALRQD